MGLEDTLTLKSQIFLLPNNHYTNMNKQECYETCQVEKCSRERKLCPECNQYGHFVLHKDTTDLECRVFAVFQHSHFTIDKELGRNDYCNTGKYVIANESDIERTWSLTDAGYKRVRSSLESLF